MDRCAMATGSEVLVVCGSVPVATASDLALDDDDDGNGGGGSVHYGNRQSSQQKENNIMQQDKFSFVCDISRVYRVFSDLSIFHTH